MPAKIYHIKLTKEERNDLEALSRKQKAAASKVNKAKAMSAMDCGESGSSLKDEDASRLSGLTTRSLQNLRKRVCEAGASGALERKPRLTPPVPPEVTGEVEAHIVQIACSDAPRGFSRWTLQMTADRATELKVIDSISYESVRLVLKKTN